MVRYLPLVLFVMMLFFSCSPDQENTGDNNPPPTVPLEGALPAQMPGDFYIAVREKGGSEPYDNVFYVSADSISREAWYYNFQTINKTVGDPGKVGALYQDVVALHPERIASRSDSMDRITDRGGEITDILADGKLLRLSNVSNSYIEGESGKLFNQVNNLVKSFVMDQFADLMRRVDLEVDPYELGEDLLSLEVRINDYPLVQWEGSGGAPIPEQGYNAVLPGKYHLYGKAQTEEGFVYITDSLEVGEENMRLKIKVLSDKLLLEK